MATHIHRTVIPGETEATVLAESGESLIIPEDWSFLPAGDAGLTRSVKAKGMTWVVRVRRGRRYISKGIWARDADIQRSREEVEEKRATPEYVKKLKSGRIRREKKQQEYVVVFFNEVLRFLDFHPKYQKMAKVLAEKVVAHATPVGSGTVARTRRIPVARRAEAAVIAWMRHQTTSYESVSIARVKGRRREVRRKFAAESVKVLQAYRLGSEVSDQCPLKSVLN